MMLPTPSTSHVNYDRVYEPAEDSYLLLDTLSSESETSFLRGHFPEDSTSPLAIEIGTGSGVVLAFLTAQARHILGRSDVATLGVDVNEFATKAATETLVRAAADARDTAVQPGVFIDCIVGELTSAIKSGSVDILIFNPPYVPTEWVPDAMLDATESAAEDTFARDSRLLSLSTDGGIDGMEITDRLFAQIPDILSFRGVAYILLCGGNKPEEVMRTIRSWPPMAGQSWSVEKVGSSGKKAGWEKLCVIRIFRESKVMA